MEYLRAAVNSEEEIKKLGIRKCLQLGSEVPRNSNAEEGEEDDEGDLLKEEKRMQEPRIPSGELVSDIWSLVREREKKFSILLQERETKQNKLLHFPQNWWVSVDIAAYPKNVNCFTFF